MEGPAPYIPLELVIKAIKLMKCGKATATFLIVAEMLKASGVEGAWQIRYLIEDIIYFGKIPSEWEESIIVSLKTGKGVALERGNYRGIKLLDQVMNALEMVAKNFLRQVRIDDMQFGFMPGCSTTDAIFIVHQLQEKFHAVNKTMYMAVVCLEKAFDCTPRRVIWWALRKLGVGEWLVWPIQSMYKNDRSRVHVGACWCSPRFLLSPLMFIIVLGALSQEFRTGCQWENLYANDLVSLNESLEELQENLILWKTKVGGKVKGQHGQSLGPDICGVARCASEVQQRPLCHMPQGRPYKLHFLWWFFKLGPQEIQWFPWLSEARSQLQV